MIHQMHSVNDSLVFAVWQNGVRLRALGMAIEGGIFVDEGEPTPAERPFWAGDRDQKGCESPPVPPPRPR